MSLELSHSHVSGHVMTTLDGVSRAFRAKKFDIVKIQVLPAGCPRVSSFV